MRVCPFCFAVWLRDSMPSRFECGRYTLTSERRYGDTAIIWRSCLDREAEITAAL